MDASKLMTALRRTVVILAVVAIAAVGYFATRPGPLAFAGGGAASTTPVAFNVTGVPADFASKDELSRGKYLTQAADCQACHTTKGGQPFAGGRSFKTPFGTLFSPNITPDTGTGIGAWSDEDFVRAVHKGVGRDGKNLYPAFPYPAYTYLSDADVLAIKTYLFSLKPVSNPAPENELMFPFNQRKLMLFWAMLFNWDQRFKPVENRSAEWNRGAYLVEGLGHCGDCHTPRTVAQSLKNSAKFSGNVVDGWRAYNITSDKQSGIGAWSDAELAQYLGGGHASGRGTASGPMGEVVELSTSNLTASDVQAMVVYLRSIPAISSNEFPAPRLEPAPPMAAKDLDAGGARGQKIFAGLCVSCHSWQGNQALSSRATLTGVRAVNDPSAINVAQMVMHGTQGLKVAGQLAMPGFGRNYSDEEIAAVSNYVTARYGAGPSSVTAEQVKTLRAGN